MRPITLLFSFRVYISLVHLSFLLLVATQARAASVLQDIQTLAQRRASTIVSGATNAASISSWLSTLGTDGKWPDSDINYTTGCSAQTGSWPAQEHWERIVTLSSAWHGGLKGATQFANDTDLRDSISLAMGFWFENDFTDSACIDSGGDASCPCGTSGFWNKNWFANIIGIPGFVGESCLLLNNTLLSTELSNCTHMTSRAYATFLTGINGVSSITGANTLDIASIGVDLALLTTNQSLLQDAFDRVHNEVVIENATSADGIRPDGSFGQHTGMLYNGNYGKDYANDVFDFELEAANTAFQATDASRSAFETLWEGNVWMIYRNTLTNVLHWDFSVLGRFISFPVADNQATENLKTNITQLQVLAQEWQSEPLTNAFNLLSGNTTTANSGPLLGNRMFFDNDYMVQRGSGYATTLKMYSKRTRNTECTNEQNPLGFHLSDGTLYTYISGDEYEDIFAAWDWNLIPGTTVDYGATALNCTGAGHAGTQTLVGGASDGTVGVAAMRYETPTSKTLNWRKTWFFLDNDVQHVMVARIISTTDAPVFSVLDQRRHNGDVLVDGVTQQPGNFSGVQSLWHGNVGYTFNTSNTAVSLSVDFGDRTGDWSTIGTSSQGVETVDLFSAWLSHSDLTADVEYTIYPATTPETFSTKSSSSQLQTIRNDGSISALLDAANNVAMFVFWETDGGKTTIPSVNGAAPITVQSTSSTAVIVRMDSWNVTISEPTQLLSNVTLAFTLGSGSIPPAWTGPSTTSVSFTLPSGGLAGASISSVLFP